MPRHVSRGWDSRSWLFGVLLASSLLGGGCDGRIGDPQGSPQTSCGPNTRSGQYYDFKTRSCVTPASDEQLAALYDYAQLVRIAAAGDPLIRANIEFTKPLTPDGLSGLAAEPYLGVVEQLELYFPHLVDGLRSGVSLTPATSGADALGAARATLVSRYADPALPIEQTIRDGLDVAFAADDLAVARVRVRSHASELLALWEKHPDDVAYVMPLDSPVPWPDESPEFLK